MNCAPGYTGTPSVGLARRCRWRRDRRRRGRRRGRRRLRAWAGPQVVRGCVVGRGNGWGTGLRRGHGCRAQERDAHHEDLAMPPRGHAPHGAHYRRQATRRPCEPCRHPLIPASCSTCCQAGADWQLHTLETLARCESPSDDRRGARPVRAISCSAAVRSRGRRSRAFRRVRPAITCSPSSARARTRTLLLGHLDTVWPMGTLVRHAGRRRDGRLHGPGVFDMKAGLAHRAAGDPRAHGSIGPPRHRRVPVHVRRGGWQRARHGR